MRSWQLARFLLSEPDAEVAICAMGHTYYSLYHRDSHGDMQAATATISLSYSDEREGKCLIASIEQEGKETE